MNFRIRPTSLTPGADSTPEETSTIGRAGDPDGLGNIFRRQAARQHERPRRVPSSMLQSKARPLPPGSACPAFGRLGVEHENEARHRHRPAPAPHVGFVPHLDGLDDRLARQVARSRRAAPAFRRHGPGSSPAPPPPRLPRSAASSASTMSGDDPGACRARGRQGRAPPRAIHCAGYLGKNIKPHEIGAGGNRRLHRLGRREAADLDLNGHGGPQECPAPPWPGRPHR